MPEKTLKEKVEAAKQEISECIAGPPCISCKIITEALTALEEENMMLRGSVKGLEDLLQRLEDEGRILQEAPDGK